MGNMQAMGYAGLVDDGTTGLTMALSAHLQSNHFPPVPLSMVPVCVEAIDLANQDDYDAMVDMPPGITDKGATAAPVWAIVEQHHLGAFINDPDDDRGEQCDKCGRLTDSLWLSDDAWLCSYCATEEDDE